MEDDLRERCGGCGKLGSGPSGKQSGPEQQHSGRDLERQK